MPSPRILCVSFDRVVSELRCNSLMGNGYDVTALTNVSEALDLLYRGGFDVVIVGHRFSLEEKYLLAVEALEKLNTPVILVCGATPDSEIPATVRVYALEGNAGLLSALVQILPAKGALRATAA